MNFWQFLSAAWTANAEVIKGLAWPMALLATVFILRAPLSQLILRIREASGANWKVIFDGALADGQEDADILNERMAQASGASPAPENTEESKEAQAADGEDSQRDDNEIRPVDMYSYEAPPLPEYFLDVAEVNPARAINDSMTWVELMISRALNNDDFSTVEPVTAALILRANGKISQATVRLIRNLTRAYEGFKRAENASPTKEDAIAFVKLASIAGEAVITGL